MAHSPIILRIAVPSPLPQLFDYVLPNKLLIVEPTLLPGMRVKVPFAHRQLVGILIEVTKRSTLPPEKLKAIIAMLDPQPILSEQLIALAKFASGYYHYPIGEVCATMLPVNLRKGESLLGVQTQAVYTLTANATQLTADVFKRAPRQYELYQALQRAGKAGLSVQHIRQLAIQTSAINGLVNKQLIQVAQKPITTSPATLSMLDGHNVILNSEQQHAVTTINNKLAEFAPYLLHGITGSGKTEVYLQVIAAVLKQGKQALLLVPEIGLTPQTVSRIQQRFSICIAVLHSGLTNRERQLAWEQAWRGEANIVIGTRSALFAPLPNLGVIIVDEEHDTSFKQQEGWRYSARDLSIVRAQLQGIPVILGSATPSLETLHNANINRYQLLTLTQRAGNAVAPTYHLIDLRKQPLNDGISIELRHAIEETLQQQQQALVFLNRRGYAPVLICHDCGWSAMCEQCDARMTLHQARARLQCHHCGVTAVKPTHCPDCQCQQLVPVGVGTERVANALMTLFPEYSVLRIDSDTTRRKGSMHAYVDTIQQGEPCILLGTQLLAKGHHFPNVTLVAILNADTGLYSADFRATEQLAQLLTQVGGRAGRSDKPGKVLIQTHMPQHPLLQQLLTDGFAAFADTVLIQRQHANLPPFARMALLRVEAPSLQQANTFLQTIRHQLMPHLVDGVQLLGPMPASMARKANYYRVQLLWQSLTQSSLHHSLTQLISQLASIHIPRQLRWHLDVDPLDVM